MLAKIKALDNVGMLEYGNPADLRTKPLMDDGITREVRVDKLHRLKPIKIAMVGAKYLT